jgi:Uncharacterised nucleotidyltransferase
MMNTIERKILACAAHVDHFPEGRPWLLDFMPFDTDMERLLNIALKEGLGGFLYRSLKKSDMLGRLKNEQRRKLENHYYQTARFNLNLLHDLKKALHHSNQRNIPVVLLQGIHLILELYQDVGLRPMTDIDLWVLKKDYASFADTMIGLGYERNPLYPNTFRRGSTIVDLHTHLLWADRIRSRRFLLASTDEDVFHRCRVVDVEGEAGLCLNLYDQVIYLGLHALKHRFNRLIWLADIKNIISCWDASDWETLHNRAIEFGQGKILTYVLFLLSHLLDYAPSEGVPWIPEKRVNLIERKTLMGRVKGDSLPLWTPLFLFSSQGNLGAHLCFILETLFPRLEVLRQIFPSPPDATPWKLYLRRIFQILHMTYLSLIKMITPLERKNTSQ